MRDGENGEKLDSRHAEGRTWRQDGCARKRESGLFLWFLPGAKYTLTPLSGLGTAGSLRLHGSEDL